MELRVGNQLSHPSPPGLVLTVRSLILGVHQSATSVTYLDSHDWNNSFTRLRDYFQQNQTLEIVTYWRARATKIISIKVRIKM